MPDKKNDFEEAMRKLAEETRRGVSRTHPLTAEQKQAIRTAIEQGEKEAPTKPRRHETKHRIVKRRDRGQDIDL